MEKKRGYQICKCCIMDTSDIHIEFDENGICNHCRAFKEQVKPRILTNEQKAPLLRKLIKDIKTAGKGKKYDCVVGLSGGMDSSYVVHLTKKYGLRTLVVHFDNGWDSELAIKNIENIINKTGFDYYNYIVDWQEFKDLQLSYFKASVVDIEVPTDMGIFSIIPKIAREFRVKYHLFGANIETENIMGKEWRYNDKMDTSNLLAIHKKFGTKKLKTFPMLSPLEKGYINSIIRIKKVNLLTFADCNYDRIKETLSKEYNWRDYGVKHGESTFTKFYQSYILPKKFGFDKRRAHLSDLICSGQITRDEALDRIKIPVYNSKAQEQDEYNYVISKWGLTPKEFEEIMARPIHHHNDYTSGRSNANSIEKILLVLGAYTFKIIRYLRIRYLQRTNY